jgi:hypothetical protein
VPKAIRVANARAAAQSYAPTPNGSTITYGLIAAALMLVCAILAGAFYRVDVFAGIWGIATAVSLAFVAGVALRLWRQHEHERAFDAEYAKRATKTPPAPEDAAGTSVLPETSAHAATGRATSETVTFKSPFLLPGLDRPHPAGTFEVRRRLEAIDVTFSASIVTLTIMLTNGGSVEALDVKADDLAAALRLDASRAG